MNRMMKLALSFLLAFLMVPAAEAAVVLICCDANGKDIVFHTNLGTKTANSGDTLSGALSDSAPTGSCGAGWAYVTFTTWTSGGQRHWEPKVTANTNRAPGTSTLCTIYANGGQQLTSYDVIIAP